MLTLNSNLQAAQDGDIHHPIVRLMSKKPVDDIPFVGNIFTTSTKEMLPKYIIHSSGRIIGFSLKNFSGSVDHLYMFYTDENRVEFTIDIPILTNSFPTSVATRDIQNFAITELANGDIGIVYIRLNGSNYELRAFAVNISGVTTIADYLIISNTYTKYSLSVKRLADDSYYLIYNSWNSSTPAWSVYTRTSSDFTSWGSAGDIVASFGLTPYNTIYNLASDFDLIETVAGSELLLFFYFVDALDTNNNPLRNIYFSKSTDNGVTWGTATQVTSYTDFTKIGYYPSIAQTDATNMYFGFTEESNALWIGSNTSGWPTVHTSNVSINVSYLMLDAPNQKLYALISNHGPVYYDIQGVIEIDINTWTIVRTRDFYSTPIIPAVFEYVSSTRLNYKTSMYGNKVIFGSVSHFGVWDATTDTIKTFSLMDSAGTETTKNVIGCPVSSIGSDGISFYDETNNWLWLFGIPNISGNNYRLVVGHIDLDEIGSEYTFTTFVDYNLGNYIYNYDVTQFRIYGSEVWLCGVDVYNNIIEFVAFDSPTQARSYQITSDPTRICRKGMIDFVKIENKIYFIFPYHSSEGYENQKGLGILDLTNDNVSFAVPAYKTANDYGFKSITTNENLGELYIGTSSDGVVIYNIVTEQFTRLSADEIPGITPNNSDILWYPLYDQTNDRFFAISWGIYGITTFLRDGKFKQTMYKLGTKTTDWIFGATDNLINGITDFNAQLAVDEDNKVWCFWQKDKTNFTQHYLAWDNIEPQFDLSEYVLTDKEISWSRTIDGEPNELGFSLSHGHLFDPTNQLSLFSVYVKKGRKLTLEVGEKYNEIDYFHNQGTFIVTENSIKYSSDVYPEISVKAADRRILWVEDEQLAIGYVNEYPEDILSDILQTLGEFLIGEISIPSMVGSIRIDAQWAEGDLNEMVNTIVKRFGYFPKITIDDTFTIGKISNTNSVTHVYSDKDAILEYTPDDKYSSFVNSITAIGEERDEIEVLFPEERIEGLSGTIGWWGGTKKYTVWYSDDKSRRVRYPRLEVIASTKSIMFNLVGQVEEAITEIDVNEQYCVVTVEVPNLIPVLAGAIAAIIAGMVIGDVVVTFVSGGKTIPVGSYICNAAIVVALNVLGSVVNFQYEIHGKPLGYIRRSVEYTANDSDHQNEIGKIIRNQIEAFGAYTVGDCRFVADFELLITQLQRKRVTFSKITHLQDEEGDTIQIPHPYTDFPTKVFVTNINRKWKLGENSYCLDEIEGWRI